MSDGASGQQLRGARRRHPPTACLRRRPTRRHEPSHETAQAIARAAGREPLSRERIIEAALRIIDDEGVDALSMRRLAATLGVQAMSLYNHVERQGRDVSTGSPSTSPRTCSSPRRTEGGWEDGIRSVAYAFRRASLRHPRAGELVLTRQLASPGALPVINCSLDGPARARLRRGERRARPAAAHRLPGRFADAGVPLAGVPGRGRVGGTGARGAARRLGIRRGGEARAEARGHRPRRRVRLRRWSADRRAAPVRPGPDDTD